MPNPHVKPLSLGLRMEPDTPPLTPEIVDTLTLSDLDLQEALIRACNIEPWPDLDPERHRALLAQLRIRVEAQLRAIKQGLSWVHTNKDLSAGERAVKLMEAHTARSTWLWILERLRLAGPTGGKTALAELERRVASLEREVEAIRSSQSKSE